MLSPPVHTSLSSRRLLQVTLGHLHVQGLRAAPAPTSSERWEGTGGFLGSYCVKT
jgi:hypothetical protein